MMILVSDIDGTILDRGSLSVPADAEHLFRAAQSAGWTLGLATSRPFESVMRMWPEACPLGFIIANDGALTYTKRADGAWRVARKALLKFDTKTVFALTAIADATVLVMLDDTSDYSVCASVLPQHEYAMETILSGRSRLNLPVRSESFIDTNHTLSIGLIFDDEGAARGWHFDPSKSQILVFEETRAGAEGLWWVEMRSQHADKGVALDEYLSTLPIPDDVVFLGDGRNDLGIATRSTHVYTPVWADEKLKSIADLVVEARSTGDFLSHIRKTLFPEWR